METKIKHIVLTTIILVVFTLFISAIFLSTRNKKDKTLKLKDEIDLNSEKIEYYRGVVTVNDSVAISGNSFLIENCKERSKINKNVKFGDFKGPYRIIKKANSEVFKIIIQKDTICFEFISLY